MLIITGLMLLTVVQGRQYNGRCVDYSSCCVSTSRFAIQLSDGECVLTAEQLTIQVGDAVMDRHQWAWAQQHYHKQLCCTCLLPDVLISTFVPACQTIMPEYQAELGAMLFSSSPACFVRTVLPALSGGSLTAQAHTH